MTKTYTLLSDLDADMDFLRNIKHRDIEQKFLYLEEGAEKYYDTERTSKGVIIKGDILNVADLVKFIEPRINPKKKYSLICLGCGNSKKEIEIVSKLKNKKIYFFGVDSSRAMLDKTEETMKKEGIEGKMILADFSSFEFRNEINNLTRGCDNRIFAFIGYTISMFSNTDIVDTFFNILKKGDYIWLDAVTRKNLDQEEYLEKFNDCEKLLENREIREFFFRPLDVLGIDKKCGEMIVSSLEEESIGSLRFGYSFQFKKPVTVKYRNEVIHILPPEKIKLLELQIYHPKTMIHFFESHGFKFVDSQVSKNNSNGQFLFIRK